MNAINAIFNNETLRRFFLTLRVPLALLALIGVLMLMKREWFLPGLIVSLLGAMLQWWCFACLRKQQTLAFNGPYGFVRNPMYLGRFLLIAGVILMTGNFWILAGFSLLYWFYMVNRVSREEKTLAGIFGEEYVEYCRQIPRFFPSFRHHPNGKAAYFSWSTFQQNHGLVNAIGVLLAYAAIWFWLFRYQT